MWKINSDDVARAKERAQRRRGEIEAKYQEDVKALDAEVEAMETLERVAGEFAQKLTKPGKEAGSAEPPQPAPTDTAEPAAEPAAEPSEPVPMSAGESKSGSRWRLHLGNRPGEADPANALGATR